MNKEFPLEYTERKAVVFDVAFVKGRDIDVCDIDLDKVGLGMFVVFYAGFIEAKGERLYEIFDFHYIKTAKDNDDKYSTRIAFELAVKGSVQERFTKLYQFVIELVTGRQVTYPD